MARRLRKGTTIYRIKCSRSRRSHYFATSSKVKLRKAVARLSKRARRKCTAVAVEKV
jgi:hypothetical protein